MLAGCAIFLLSYAVLSKTLQPRTPPATPATASQGSSGQSVQGPVNQVPPASAKDRPVVNATAMEAPEREIVLEDDRRRLVLSSRGASLVSAYLKVNDSAGIRGQGQDLLKMTKSPNRHFTMESMVLPDMAAQSWVVEQSTGSSATFSWTQGEVQIRKTFTLGQDYILKIGIESRGVGAETILWGARGLQEDDPSASHYAKAIFLHERKRGGVAYTSIAGSDLVSRREDDLDDNLPSMGRIAQDDSESGIKDLPLKWAGIRGKYFMVLVSGSPRAFVASESGKPEDPSCALVFDAANEWKAEVTAFLGPCQSATLAALEPGLEDSINEGWFSFIRVILLWILEFFYRIFSNYGLSIIGLTVLVRILIHPLTRFSQTRMLIYQEKMKVVQPKLEALKKKYAKDKQAFARAQMELMKNEKLGLGMMSGCLPLFLQMPIFIGLFNLLNEYIELRSSRFLYISDLSHPDRLAILPFFPGEFNLLPILTLSTTVFQLWRSMKRSQGLTAEQLAQQKMMMYMMPGIMLLMTYRFPAGVLVYWFTSAVIGIAESELVRRSLEKKGTKAGPLPYLPS